MMREMRPSFYSFTAVLMLVLGGSVYSGAAVTKRVVVLGDSIAEGLGVDRAQAFPAVLQKLLSEKAYFNVTVVNAGSSGSTSSSGLSRLQWQLRSHIDVLILELGANDMLRGQPVSLVRKNLTDIIRRAQEAHVTVLLAGMKAPPNYGETFSADFQKIYPELAKTFHVALIPFLLEGVAGDPTLNQADGIHPTIEGHIKVAHHVLHYLEPLL